MPRRDPIADRHAAVPGHGAIAFCAIALHKSLHGSKCQRAHSLAIIGIESRY
ncbi:MAG: hypothetical protein EBE86_014655 [Hormoscilla sp. GUM202]|nr:hypothetical protein [Hormoscilla sp. GUM202]